jgi:hypothetical protein
VLVLSSVHRTDNAVVNVLRSAALLFAEHGHPATAARLLGAAEATGHIGGGHTLVIDEARSAIAQALPAGAVAAAFEEGRRLSLRAATQLALDTLSEVERSKGDRPAEPGPPRPA